MLFSPRFSDFLVYEIDNSGNVVHLTNFDLPRVTKPTDESNVQPIETLKEENDKEVIIDLS